MMEVAAGIWACRNGALGLSPEVFLWLGAPDHEWPQLRGSRNPGVPLHISGRHQGGAMGMRGV